MCIFISNIGRIETKCKNLLEKESFPKSAGSGILLSCWRLISDAIKELIYTLCKWCAPDCFRSSKTKWSGCYMGIVMMYTVLRLYRRKKSFSILSPSRLNGRYINKAKWRLLCLKRVHIAFHYWYFVNIDVVHYGYWPPDTIDESSSLSNIFGSMAMFI